MQLTGSGRGFPPLTLIPPWSGRRMHLLDPSSRFSPWNLDLRCWMNSCIARSRKTRQYFDFANLVLLSQWLHLRVFAPIVSSCIPNFVIFGFFDWWVRFLSVPAPNARHMARPNSPQLLTKSEDDSCFVLWSPQLPGGFGQNLPEIREQISDLSSENSEILEKLCYVKWGRLVWRNLAGVGTSWYGWWASALRFSFFLPGFRRRSTQKYPKVTWHLPLPLQSWSLHQDDHGHGGAWCLMVLVSTSEGPMLLGGWRCPWVSGMSPEPSWGCDRLRLVATDLDLDDLKGCFFIGFFL